MSIFDITPDSDFPAVVDRAMDKTKQFLVSRGRALYNEEFTHEWVDWNPGGFFKEKLISSSDIRIRNMFEQDKTIRVSRLSLKWNSKDNIVDVIVLEPKYPVLIEYLNWDDFRYFAYFRFVTKTGRSNIIFIRRNWKTDISNIPCKNPDKVKYIYNYEL